MITTRFINISEYPKYQEWLKSLDQESRDLYFGAAVADSYIESLTKRIVEDPLQHNFLVAEDVFGNWVGVMHIAKINPTSVEFGISVAPDKRRLGIGNQLMRESIVWCCNRFINNVYLHCLSRNRPIHLLCEQNGLSVINNAGDGEVCASLPPPSLITIVEEVANMHLNIYTITLNRALNTASKLIEHAVQS